MLTLLLSFLLGLLVVASGMAMYLKGEAETKWLGKPNSWFKYLMGIPVGVLGALALWSWIPLLAIVTYFIACEFGYGDNNLLTKILGKRGAITFCGTALGVASFPFLGFWCILQGVISGGGFYYISILDDAGKVKEPFVAILRGAVGLCLILSLFVLRLLVGLLASHQ